MTAHRTTPDEVGGSRLDDALEYLRDLADGFSRAEYDANLSVLVAEVRERRAAEERVRALATHFAAMGELRSGGIDHPVCGTYRGVAEAIRATLGGDQ